MNRTAGASVWALALGDEQERQLGRLLPQSSLGTLAPGAERGQDGEPEVQVWVLAAPSLGLSVPTCRSTRGEWKGSIVCPCDPYLSLPDLPQETGLCERSISRWGYRSHQLPAAAAWPHPGLAGSH